MDVTGINESDSGYVYTVPGEFLTGRQEMGLDMLVSVS